MCWTPSDLIIPRMSAEERKGFAYALDVLELQLLQLEAEADQLSSDPAAGQTLSPRDVLRSRVAFTRDIIAIQRSSFSL